MTTDETPAAGLAAVSGAAPDSPAASASGTVQGVAAGAGAPPGRTWRIWGVDFDGRLVQIVSIATVILIVAFNNRFVEAEYDRFVLEFIIPIAIVLLVWREDPRQYGLRLGDWRLGLVVVAAGVAVMAVVIWFLGRQPDFRVYYTDTIAGRPMWRLILDTGVDLLAWEFFFRGWLLWALGRKYGTDGIWLQIIPFALMHVWKPEIEQFSTLIGGAVFGLLAWRTKSFLWGWLLHWFMMAWVLLVAAGYV
jgi:membrane protease YdiL (CAAX protease family)